MKINLFLYSFFELFSFGYLVTFAFFLADAIWLNALPILGLSYGSVVMPLLSFTFLRMGILFIWLILAVTTGMWKPQPNPYSHWQILVIPQILLLIFAMYGAFIEPNHLAVSKMQIIVKDLNRPIRIVQLSDIHVERTSPREQALPQLVASLNPDMIVITGDFINEDYRNDPTTIQDLRNLISQLHAPMGIFGVNGNAETPAELRNMLSGLNISVLDNQAVRITQINDHFAIIGLSYLDLSDEEPILDDLMTQLHPGDFSLLLFHTPDLAYVACADHVNLYLAGHTHGGQIRLPFYGAIYTNSNYGKTFEMGLYHLADMTLYVNRGLGFTGGPVPRIRFLAPPEVAVFDLIPAK